MRDGRTPPGSPARGPGRTVVAAVVAVGALALGACTADDDATDAPFATGPSTTGSPGSPPSTIEAPTTTTPPGSAAPPGSTTPGPAVSEPAVPDVPEPEMLGRPESTGSGVTVVAFGDGVDVAHPDLRNADGSTRVAAIVDLSGQRAGCAPDRPEPVVHLRDAIDASLVDPSRPLDHRDAVGTGTALAGLAVGNGRASGGRYAGLAPDADLVVVKNRSQGAPPVGDDPGDEPVAGCLDDALDVVDLVLAGLDQPAVGLVGPGTQWGPIDGTSAASRRFAETFGPGRPGRALVVAAGDEGDLPTHAGGELVPGGAVEVPFDRPDGETSNPTLWYSGDLDGTVTVTLDAGQDGAPLEVGPVAPGESVADGGVTVIHYEPGTEFHPWTSTSGDHAAWIEIDAPAGSGVIRVDAAPGDAVSGDESGTGRVDVYGDLLGAEPRTTSIRFTDHLVPGRLADEAATPGAIVVTSHVARVGWVDATDRVVDQRSVDPPPVVGDRWSGAAAGPTRDGRDAVVVSAPGHHAVAPLAAGSVLTRRPELVVGGELGDPRPVAAPDPGRGYAVVTGTGPAAALTAGAVAALLEVEPTLTADQVAELIAATAATDRWTGPSPSPSEWGAGKLDPVALLTELTATP